MRVDQVAHEPSRIIKACLQRCLHTVLEHLQPRGWQAIQEVAPRRRASDYKGAGATAAFQYLRSIFLDGKAEAIQVQGQEPLATINVNLHWALHQVRLLQDGQHDHDPMHRLDGIKDGPSALPIGEVALPCNQQEEHQAC